MPGNQTIDLKKWKSQFLYVPLPLRVFLSSIPFLILVLWYAGRMLGEQTYYEAGLNWIKMVRMVEKEAFRFEDRMENDQLKKLDLRIDYQEKSLPDRDPEKSVYSYRSNTGTDKGTGDIQVEYLYLGDDDVLMSIDATKREQSLVKKGTAFYDQAVKTLNEESKNQSLVRLFYESGGKKYYACFTRLEPTIPVCCGNLLLSDGSEGSVILISGQYCYDSTKKYVNANRWRLYLAFIAVFFLFIGIVCFIIKLSLRRLEKFIGLMQDADGEDSDYSEIDMTQVEMGASDEIRGLLESFHLMFLSIQQYQKSKLNIRELYESLLPAAFLALFKQDDIRRIRPGDKAVVRGRVLSVLLVSSEENMQEYIQGRNRLIAQILNLLDSMNLIVTELEYDRISALRIQEDEEMPPDNYDEEIRTIRSMYREGSGVDDIVVTDETGEFCYSITGIAGNMKIRMEQVSAEEQQI